MTRLRTALALALPLLAAASLAACNDLDNLLKGGSLTLVEVQLFNDADATIHILVEGEDFGAANRLDPGGARLVEIGVLDGTAVDFRAGRNGTVLDTTECVPRRSGGRPVSFDPTVVWNGDEDGLTCAGWGNP